MAVQLPRFLQTKTYSAQRVRAMLADQGGGIQNGVVNAGDLLVSQKAGGANMSVDVAAGAAWVFGTTVARQGAYNAYNDAVVNLSIAANSSGNPRLDQIILRIYDTIDGGAGSDQATVEVLQGAATAGATLANRAGAAALPASSILLGDVLVANAAGSIVNGSIRDRRQWARGAFVVAQRTSGTNLTTNAAPATPIEIDTTSLKRRVECSGKALLITFLLELTASPGFNWYVSLMVDGALATGYQSNSSRGGNDPFDGSFTYTPTAGSHTFAVGLAAEGGQTTTLYQSGCLPTMTISEVAKDNIFNNPAGYG